MFLFLCWRLYSLWSRYTVKSKSTVTRPARCIMICVTILRTNPDILRAKYHRSQAVGRLQSLLVQASNCKFAQGLLLQCLHRGGFFLIPWQSRKWLPNSFYVFQMRLTKIKAVQKIIRIMWQAKHPPVFHLNLPAFKKYKCPNG